MIEPRPILLVAATLPEMLPTVQRLKLSRLKPGLQWLGSSQGVAVAAQVTGVGGERMASQVAQRLEQGAWLGVLHIGFVGGLRPGLTAGTLHVPREICNEKGQRIGIAAAEHVNEPESASGSLLTLDRMVSTLADKAALFEHFESDAVDMEAFAVARLLRDQDMPYVGLRAVSDPADTVLPAEAMHWLDDAGRARAWPAVRWALRRPTRLAALFELGRNSQKAGQAIAKAVEQCLPTLAKAWDRGSPVEP